MDIEQARIHALDALERADEADGGPWAWRMNIGNGDPDDYGGLLCKDGFTILEAWSTDTEVGIAVGVENAQFIVHSRTDIPLLANNLLNALEEIKRLTGCLEQANKQFEHFEREWYLRGDEIERLEAMNMDLSAQLAEAKLCPLCKKPFSKGRSHLNCGDVGKGKSIMYTGSE